ncbi:MAG: single-stranded DNA-binding protein [Ignavibacteriae bacterium]|nr:single-stranded DNA-binding protein [Ignavibacteriota bacterium]
MAKGLNKVMLIGRLGKDPELKYTEKGTAYCNFSIATDESYKDENGNKVERTEWHNIVAWRKLAEICQQYLKKGSKIYCEGKLQTDSYEKDGVKRYSTKIVMTDMTMLDSKGSADKVSDDTGKVVDSGSGEEDDLPF